MPIDFWIGIAGQTALIVGVAVHLERRLTRLETNVRWLISQRSARAGEEHH